MFPDFKTYSHPNGAGEPVTLVPAGVAPFMGSHLDSAQGGIHEDINAGGRPGATLTGPARAVVSGDHPKDVVIQACVPASGATLVVQISTDGLTWHEAGTFALPSDETMGVRFEPHAGFYRAQVVLGEQPANRVTVYSQCRN